MQDRVPLYPGRVKLSPVAGQDNIFDMVRADEATQPGTPLNKETLLKDTTAEKYGLDRTGVVDDALDILADGIATITVSTEPGAAVTCSNGSKKRSKLAENGTCVFHVTYGTWTIQASIDGNKGTEKPVFVAEAKDYAVNVLAHIAIYGVQWDGSSTTLWSRTDDATGFVNPTPAVGNGTGESPFDDLMPWAGMVIEEDKVGTLVKIPKFWFKWSLDGKSLKLQITNERQDGFYTSPAHADRGDGKGERDYVYIGRYHCDENYKSVSGNSPKVSTTRNVAWQGVHDLGDPYWQTDIQLRYTIWMLYLVEYADWNSQKAIGYGCSQMGDSTFKMGATDSMQYHTGTNVHARTTYGCTQYRRIEGLWDNVMDWLSGCYFDSNNRLCLIQTPSAAQKLSGGVPIGFVTGRGFPTKFALCDKPGFEWCIYPIEAVGSDSTTVTDIMNFGDSSKPIMETGAYWRQDQVFGLFFIQSRASNFGGGGTGTRLQKLP